MTLCIPVNEDLGLQSQVCAHFGSAPTFLLVDADTGACRAVVNQNQHHGHGMCTPLASLANETFESIVVGGIGMGAYNKLTAANIHVFISEFETVADTVAAYKAGTLPLMMPGRACAGHGHEHEHA